MMNDVTNTNSTYYDKIFEELEAINSIVTAIKMLCLELEFNGQYYGTSVDASKHLSAERNRYITMLSVLIEKTQRLMELNCDAEKEWLLQKNSDNSRR